MQHSTVSPDSTPIQDDSRLVTANAQTTLLLDHLWMPIRVITASRLFYHLFRDRVEAIDLEHNTLTQEEWTGCQDILLAKGTYPELPSPSRRWAVPTLAVVRHPFKRQHPLSRKLDFDELLELYDHTCQICLRRFPRGMFAPKEIFNRDHVLPRSRGGPDEDFNIVLACKTCNSIKGSKYPYYNALGQEIVAKPRPHHIGRDIAPSSIRPEWRPFLWKIRVA